VELTGAIEIHFVNMVKWRQLAEKDIAGNPLHRWLAWLDPESPPELVEEVKNMDGAIAFAEDRQGFVMQDDESRELYWSRQIAEMDRRAEIAFALDKAALNNARNALAEGLSLEQIHRITGLDMETIADLQPR